MEQAIKIAIENGWKVDGEVAEYSPYSSFSQSGFIVKKHSQGTVLSKAVLIEFAVLDPFFWQALGKGLGWDKKYVDQYGEMQEVNPGENIEDYMCQLDTPIWKDEWHRLIDHLAEGKSIDSFFEELFK